MSTSASRKGKTACPVGHVPAASRCQHVKDSGERCKGRRHSGSEFCFWHDPDKRQDVLAAARKGGEVTRQRRAPAVLPKAGSVTLGSAEEVRVLLADTITRVRRGQLETSVGNCVGYLCQSALRILEAVDHEKRLAAIEEALSAQSARAGR